LNALCCKRHETELKFLLHAVHKGVGSGHATPPLLPEVEELVLLDEEDEELELELEEHLRGGI
jgi:hypothetical protein